jgi:hypothetical protein
MSNRNEITLIGCGGAGGKLVDELLNVDPRFQAYFINSSITDINTLDHKDDLDKNYLCISNNNGAGRSRELGKAYSKKYGWSILDKIESFDNKNIWFVASLGGGSGSSIVSVMLAAIKQKIDDPEDVFDKTINLIGILPRLDSSDDILKNTLETWNEIFSYGVVNNMIFVDNNNIIDGQYLTEEEINERFSILFDSIFEIPMNNGRNFDTGNLGRVLDAKGCTYIYDLPSDCTTMEQAIKEADSSSVLAKMYKTKNNTVIDPIDGKEKLKCAFVGTSFNNDNYIHEDVLMNYKWQDGDFNGYNDENNLIIVSGCYPPLYSIQVIKAELEDRQREKEKEKVTNFSEFVVDFNSEAASTVSKPNRPTSANSQKSKEPAVKSNIKKSMKKKNLFDM